MQSKRGAMTLTTLAEIGLVALIAFTFLSATQLLVNEEEVTNLYLSRDIALLTDAFHALPSNISYTYPASLDAKNIFAGEQEIIVRPDTQENPLAVQTSQARSFFTPSQMLTISSSSPIDGALFSFTKKGDTLYIGPIPDEQPSPSHSTTTLDLAQGVAVGVDARVLSSDLQKIQRLLRQEIELYGYKPSQDNASLYILLTENSGSTGYIGYAQAYEKSLAPLAQQIRTSLSQSIPLEKTVRAQQTTVSKPIITISFSTQQDTREIVSEQPDHSGSRQLLAREIVSFLEVSDE